MPVPNTPLDHILPFQIRLERVKAGQTRMMMLFLRNMERDIYGEIITSGLYAPKAQSFRERRLKALLLSINESINLFGTKAKRFNANEQLKWTLIQHQ